MLERLNNSKLNYIAKKRNYNLSIIKQFIDFIVDKKYFVYLLNNINSRD